MKLVKSARLSKKTIIIVTVILGVILLGGLGWWLFTSKANSDYRTQLTSAVTGIKKEITEQSAPVEAAVKEGNNVETMALLRKLEDSIQAKVNELPVTPSLWGMNIAQSQDAQHRNELINALQVLTTDLSKSRELLVYSHSVATSLQVIVTKTGANADQQKALADAWQAAINNLKTLAPPAAAEPVHAQIIQAATKAQAGLAALPDLFTKKDTPGFNAKQKEVEAAVAELRTLGPAITTLHETADKNVQAHYALVSQLLH
jgi:hypothetical protein